MTLQRCDNDSYFHNTFPPKWPKGYWFYRTHYHTIDFHIEQYKKRREGGVCGFSFSRLRVFKSFLNDERSLRMVGKTQTLGLILAVGGRYPHAYEYRLKPRFRKPLSIWDQEKHNKACRAIIRTLKRYNAKRINDGL